MKKSLFFLAALILTFAAYSQTITLPTGNKGITRGNDQFSGFQATFSYSEIESATITGTEKGTFSALIIEDAYPSVGNYGEPELPVFKKMIQIPVGATPKVIVKNFSSTELNLADYGLHPIFPVQPSVRKDQTDVPFVYDEKAYGMGEYNNSTLAEINIMGPLRGIIMGMLTVNPIQYNPVSHTLMVYNDIEVEVVFENANYKKTEEMFVNSFSPYFTKQYDIVFNKGVSRDVYDDHPDLYTTPVRMLVIANRIFEETLQPWIEWKTKKGFYMDVNYTDVIGTTATQIKTFIHGKYNDGIGNGTAPTFIIIVGDTQGAGSVAASQTGQYTSKATDLYYARVNTPGFFPDMYYSRMSAQTTQQLANQIEKILYYEKYQFADPTYLDNVLLIAGWDSYWAPKVGLPQINYANTYYFNEEHGYANIHKYTNPYTGCYANLNNVGFANYTAHCGETEWSDPNYSASQINSLTNVNKYFVAMGNCCLAADFGYTGNGGICFGETMMNAQQKGAVGYIGSSPSSYWGEDFHFSVGAYPGNIETVTNPTLENTQTGCYDFMFRDADFNTLCSYIFGGNLSVQYAHNNSGYTTHISAPYYWEAYNVLGDGSLMPYNAQGSENTVSHLPVIYIGLDSYQVMAVPGSYVAISKDGELLGVAVADASGVALVPITPITSGGDVDIVVTRNQYIPYITQVPAVAQEGPYVVYNSYEVGNGDILTYTSVNEDINVILKNVGIETSGALNITISCADPQLTITQATATCPAIAPDGTETVTFKVTVSNEIPDNKTFLVDVAVSDDGKSIWESKMPLKAYAPDMKLEKVLVDGVENGNLPQGTAATITTVVKNKGGADAFNLKGILDINSQYVSLACDEKSRAIINLEAGESTSFDFVVITSPDMPFGHIANFDLSVTANYGISHEETFTVSNSGSSNYCTPGNTNCSGYNDRITSIQILKTSNQEVLLNDPNPTCTSGSGYTDYTNITLEFFPGEQYTIKVKTGYQGHKVKGWIDLNGNNNFDNNEAMFVVTCSSANVEYSANFTIPQDFAPGSQRFRIRTRDGNTEPTPCDAYSYGQTLDYTAVLPELYPRVQNVEAVLTGNSITTTWTAPAEGTPIGYNIYRNGNKLNETSLLTNTTFTEVVEPQNVYAYNVTAVYAGEKESFSEMSNVICFFLNSAIPLNLVGTVDKSNVNLTWNKPENMEGVFVGYNVYKDDVKINETIVTNEEYLDEELENGDYKYNVTAVYEHGESQYSNDALLTIYVSIKDFNPNSFQIFPNPTTNHFTVSGEGLNHIEIYDVQGRLLLTHTTNLTPQTSINVSHLQGGIYFVKMYSEMGDVVVKRLVVVK